jgi:hypothetical protein
MYDNVLLDQGYGAVTDEYGAVVKRNNSEKNLLSATLYAIID